jgi:hypothetical protein
LACLGRDVPQAWQKLAHVDVFLIAIGTGRRRGLLGARRETCVDSGCGAMEGVFGAIDSFMIPFSDTWCRWWCFQNNATPNWPAIIPVVYSLPQPNHGE